jgi:hypothetical protein
LVIITKYLVEHAIKTKIANVRIWTIN